MSAGTAEAAGAVAGTDGYKKMGAIRLYVRQGGLEEA